MLLADSDSQVRVIAGELVSLFGFPSVVALISVPEHQTGG